MILLAGVRPVAQVGGSVTGAGTGSSGASAASAGRSGLTATRQSSRPHLGEAAAHEFEKNCT